MADTSKHRHINGSCSTEEFRELRQSSQEQSARILQSHRDADERWPEDEDESELETLQVDRGSFAKSEHCWSVPLPRARYVQAVVFEFRDRWRRRRSLNGARCGFQSRDDGSIGQDKSEFWCDIDDVRVAIVVGVDRRHIQG